MVESRARKVDYTVWEHIDYKPAVEKFIPTCLPAYLRDYSETDLRILDVGCNKGEAAVWLAEKGFEVLAVDINESALDVARKLANDKGVSNRIEFRNLDFLKDEISSEKFNAVMLIRVLTCFPSPEQLSLALQRISALIISKGVFYLHDFLYTPEENSYAERYKCGIKNGWRKGNFMVEGTKGSPGFIAHHHTDEEVNSIKNRFAQLRYQEEYSYSMNGNRCKMFNYIGLKK